MALAPWLQNFAADYGKNGMAKRANVQHQSGNDGAYSIPEGHVKHMGDSYAVNDKLESVSLSENPGDYDERKVKEQTNKTQNSIDKDLAHRKNLAEKDGSNIEMNYVDSTRHSFKGTDFVKLARAASNDILDGMEDLLADAEAFIHKNIPLGQREAAVAKINKVLAANGIDANLAVYAKSEAPCSGFDNFTTSEVAGFIKDDYRTAPKNWNLASPASSNHSYNTSVKEAATREATDATVRKAKLARSLRLAANDIKKLQKVSSNDIVRKVQASNLKTALAKYEKLLRLAADETEMSMNEDMDMDESDDMSMDEDMDMDESDDMSMDDDMDMDDMSMDELEDEEDQAHSMMQEALDALEAGDTETAKAKLQEGLQQDMAVDEEISEDLEGIDEEQDLGDGMDDDMGMDESEDDSMSMVSSRLNRFMRK